ncbi:UNVERIFIED_CONTAM: hypothetical protein FKN15_048577 [Acipenser sinensis]
MSEGDSNPAATPTAAPDVHGDGRWLSLHHRFVSDSKDKEPEVLFVGDSLVQLLYQFEDHVLSFYLCTFLEWLVLRSFACFTTCIAPLQIWRELFSPLHALNFGMGGDCTQHVLWRLQNGELDHINPKIIVLWVGTNNHGDTAEQVAEGIGAIVKLIHSKQPTARVLILGLLPRGKSPNALRVKNARVNQLVQEALPSLPGASFLDVDPGFVHSDGTISHHDMYDYLHLTRAGYTTVCQPIHTRLLAMLEQHKI